MNKHTWSWVGACSTGASHIKAGICCEDYAACLEFSQGDRHVLVVIVSDGAGSAEFAHVGSRLVVRRFAHAVFEFLRDGRSTAEINEGLAREWIDVIRDRVFTLAEGHALKPRAFAATLIGVIACNDRVVVCHIGDGACAIRKDESNTWQVPSWPAHGEYASSTYFITDDPQPNLQLSRVEGQFAEIAVFSDGLERLALDFSQKIPFDRFFNPIFIPLSAAAPGRNRALSAKLRSFLESPTVTERTDDDKTLVIARRVVVQ